MIYIVEVFSQPTLILNIRKKNGNGMVFFKWKYTQLIRDLRSHEALILLDNSNFNISDDAHHRFIHTRN
jgi:hypothetical protein